VKSVQDWQDAAEAIARERGDRGPDRFPFVLGIDPAPLNAWCKEDAIDTVETIFPLAVRDAAAAGNAAPLETAVATIAATHMHMGVELGLWLVQKGKVRP
jgi:hypothetical protein